MELYVLLKSFPASEISSESCHLKLDPPKETLTNSVT